jgi:hypothetical protein
MMIVCFYENGGIMLKWEPEMKPRLQSLSRKLQHHAEDNCLQVYEAQRDRAEAEKKKAELSMMILGYVQQLVISLGKKMNEQDLFRTFNEQWHTWIQQVTTEMKPLRLPRIEQEVEQAIDEVFKANLRFVHQKLADPDHGKPLRKWGAHLQLEIEERHVRVINEKFKLLKIWSKKNCDRIQMANLHTLETFSAVENSPKKYKHSRMNFSPQFATDLLRLIQERSKIEPENFQFTDEYEVEMALTTCGYAIPVFEEMAAAFRKKA